MRTAIVHYWLLNMRGGEKVVEALCRLLPDADIFTLFYDPDSVSETIRRHRVQASFLQPLRRGYRSLLPLMPMALESFDLRGYDLIVSSESGPAKGVIALVERTARLLLPHAHAISVGLVSGVSQRMDAVPLEARSDDAAHELSAAVGLCVGGARGRVRCQQRKRAAAHLEDVPARVARGEAPGGRGNVLLESGRRLLSDGFRTGALQARGLGGARLQPKWTQAARGGRWPGIQSAEASCRAEYRILWTRPG